MTLPARIRAVALLYLVVAALPLTAQDLPRAKPEDAGMSSARLERLTSTFQGYVADNRLAGSVIYVLRDGKVVYSRGVGMRDRESRAAMPEDAIFRIASQTKALVSVAAMMLQEEGALTIGDAVGRYLPEFQKTTVAVARTGGGYDVVDAQRPITIRDLLTHTAGIGYGGGVARDRWAAADIQGWYFAHRDEPVRTTVARMATLPMDAQPGERFVYGYATDILGALVEKVSGLPLDVFISMRITEPLGMKDTHFYLPAEKRARLATVYAAADSGIVRAPAEGTMNSQGQYVEGPRKSFSGGAGLLSTAPDYARFLQMLLNGGELNGVRILSPKTIQLMTADHIGERYATAGVGFGLGFSVLEDLGARGTPGSVGEFGWGGAYHSTYWVDPKEKLVVVYFTQLIPAGTIDDFAKLRALIYQSILKPVAPHQPPTTS